MATIQEQLREESRRLSYQSIEYGSADSGIASNVADKAADVIDALVEAVRDKFCPRPCNHRPDQFDVGDCVDAGECGCSASAALSFARGDS